MENNVLHGVITWGKFKPSDVAGKIAPEGTFATVGGRITGSFSVPNGSL